MNRTALTVVLVILLLASLGSNTFLYINKMKSDKELQNKMAVMKAKDSLQAELIRMEDSSSRDSSHARDLPLAS
jgi:uncharacterized membrane protein